MRAFIRQIWPWMRASPFCNAMLWLLLSPFTIIWLIWRAVLLLCYFTQYVFDVHRDASVTDQYAIGDEGRRKRDMIRLLNFAWHGVVYVPVLIVCVVANLWGADGTMVMLFGSMAFATVSLEICISVIIEKVTYLTALSRQTRRVYKTAQSEAELKLWVEYYNKRHQKARRDTAKAALVTVFSMVIFSCIVGIEGIRLVMHSGPSHAEDVEAEPIYSKVEVFKELGLDDDSLMPIAVSLSTCMFVIACAKLWIQTRHCLEKDDPLDKFATAEAAIASLPEDEADEGRAENLSNGQNVYDVEQN